MERRSFIKKRNVSKRNFGSFNATQLRHLASRRYLYTILNAIIVRITRVWMVERWLHRLLEKRFRAKVAKV